jgi:hypothetical protein
MEMVKILPLFNTFLIVTWIIIRNITRIFYYVLRFRIVKIYLFFLFLKLYKENNFFVIKIVFYVFTITNYLFSKLSIIPFFKFFTKEIMELINFYKENLILQTRFFILSILRNLLTDSEIIDFLKTQMSQIILETMIQQNKDQYNEIILYSTSESILKFGLQYLSYYMNRVGIENGFVYQSITKI